MSLTRDQIRSVAQLARIALPDAESNAVLERLNRVLGMVDRLQAVDTTGIEPMSHALDVVQPLRRDAITEADQRAQLQSGSPAFADGLFLVPRVIE